MFSERMNNKGNHHSGNNDNSWGGNNVRKSFDNYNRGGNYQHDGGNSKIEQRLHSLRLDNGGSKNESAGPKKMTWASIASQPAKPTVTTITSATKKKGSGPPPPIILGKHDLDDPAWDAPKNVVPPSPPVIAAPQPEVNEKQSSLDESPAWPTLDKAAQSQLQNQNSTERNAPSSAAAQQPSHGQHGQHQQHQGYQRSNYGNGSGNGNGHYNSNNNNNSYQHGNRDYNGGGGYNNSYSQSRQYSSNNNNSGYNNNGGGGERSGERGGGHHFQHNSYNDFSKPYHQHPHQMPSAPSQGNHRSDGSNGAPIQRGNANHQAAAVVAAPPPPANIQRKPAPEPEQPAAAAAIAKPEVANLLQEHLYNPSELDLSRVDNARFFVIKSYSEDDIHRSIKYEIWCSTEHGNKRLDQAFHEREKEGGVVYLFFSVNSSGHFCGVAQMITPVDYSSNSSVWAQDKWKGSFHVKWIYVKDVPNPQLRHIRLENNENKPVTNSRDTQEVPNHHGIQMMKIIHAFKHTTSIFDDFTHYEKRQEEEEVQRKFEPEDEMPPHQGGNNRHFDNDRSYNDRGGDFNGGSHERGGGGGGFDRGGSFNNRNGNGGGFNKYGNSGGYNNDFKSSFNGRGGFQKRNDFRSNDRNDQPQSGGFYRNKPDYQDHQDDDFGGSRGGGYRPPHFEDRGSYVRGGNRGNGGFRDRTD